MFLGIPTTIQAGMAAYRTLFSRQSAFEHVCRYVSGLLLSSNKTLQGIYSQCVEPDSSKRIGRRAMHAGVFESPWQHEQLMVTHRWQVSTHYNSQERHVLSLLD